MRWNMFGLVWERFQNQHVSLLLQTWSFRSALICVKLLQIKIMWSPAAPSPPLSLCLSVFLHVMRGCRCLVAQSQKELVVNFLSYLRSSWPLKCFETPDKFPDILTKHDQLSLFESILLRWIHSPRARTVFPLQTHNTETTLSSFCLRNSWPSQHNSSLIILAIIRRNKRHKTQTLDIIY